MQFKTIDFALWTLEEYTRPDGTKPVVDQSALNKLQIICDLVDQHSERCGAGEITTDIDPETEDLIIEFSGEGVSRGKIVLENMYK